jgi:ubiquinone/menaquinone biosynthesis C-methylase UbiE/nucleoside 2-deoxyribosyltransferase
MSFGKKIYWANSMFTESDRRFNAHCVGILRERGYKVFLPQEATINEEVSPTSEDIFRIDTTEIVNSSLLVACIDQETIDSGVACEIGIAYSCNIPIIGLYTDIRKDRKGLGKMYKNLYVIGAIESFGTIAGTVDELTEAISQFLQSDRVTSNNQRTSELVNWHYNGIAQKYSNYIERLESWYRPSWNSRGTIDEVISSLKPKRILEIGCGTGELGQYIVTTYPNVSYLGYDSSEKMVEIAQKSYDSGGSPEFTSNLEYLLALTRKDGFDLSIALFTLHDQSSKEEFLDLLKRCTRPLGHILAIDLAQDDLSRLVKMIKRGLGRPETCREPRVDPAQLASISSRLGMELTNCTLALPTVTFPSASDINDYMEFFGIYNGFDLPLGFDPEKYSRNKALVQQILGQAEFPFTDRRSFAICLMRRN